MGGPGPSRNGRPTPAGTVRKPRMTAPDGGVSDDDGYGFPWRHPPAPHRRTVRGGDPPLRRRAPSLAAADRPRHRRLLRRRADALDARLVDAVPVPGRARAGSAAARRRRQRVRGLLPRRHRLDVRSFAAAGRRGDPAPGRPGTDLHAAHRRRDRRRPAAGRTVRAAALAGSDDGDRRQSLRAARRPRGDRATEDPGFQRLLPRLGRRDLRAAGRWPRRSTVPACSASSRT